MKILITGATGFVGQHLTNALIERGHKVFCLVRNVEKARGLVPPAVQLIECDLCDEHKLDLREADEVEIICHLAGCISSGRVKDFSRVNVHGTRKILEAAKTLRKLHQFIFLSSTAVVGRNLRASITEETPCNPFSPYGKSKLMAEGLIRNFSESLPQVDFLILRAPIIYGPGQPKAVTKFFEDVDKGKIVLLGNGKNIRSMCFIRNLVDAISVLIRMDTKIGHLEILNIADAERRDLVGIALAIAHAMGRKGVRIIRLPSWFSNVALFVYKVLTAAGVNSKKLFLMATASASMDVDITKTSGVIDFRPRCNLAGALSETISWLRDTKRSRRSPVCIVTR